MKNPGSSITMDEWSQVPDALRESGARTAVILGSGLGRVADLLESVREFEVGAIGGLPASAVEGHAGKILLGEMKGESVLIVQGRIHLYEGWSAREVTAMVRFLGSLGVGRLVLTNAAGLIRESFQPGRWMLMEDHINLTGTSPLVGAARFLDLTEVYEPGLRNRGLEVAERLGIQLHSGVYASVIGPQYETPAEVRYLRQIGADAVGMSTVLEAIEARAEGMQVLGLSCLTNWAAGLSAETLSHGEVLAGAEKAVDDLVKILPSLVAP